MSYHLKFIIKLTSHLLIEHDQIAAQRDICKSYSLSNQECSVEEQVIQHGEAFLQVFLCILSLLFIVLLESKSGESPGTGRGGNFVVAEGNILVYQSLINICLSAQLFVGNKPSNGVCLMETYISCFVCRHLKQTRQVYNGSRTSNLSQQQ